jgi:hypothetical protein
MYFQRRRHSATLGHPQWGLWGAFIIAIYSQKGIQAWVLLANDQR